MWRTIVTAEYAEDPESGADGAAVAEYRASRARYIRSVTSDVEARLMATIGKRREPIVEELSNLTVLGHSRYDSYQSALRAYSAKAPRRITSGGLLPPSPAERFVPGIDKLYRAALKAADEFREVNEIIKKRRATLEELDWKMRVKVEQYGRDLIAKLETPAGLAGAFKRDPLLARAHARMSASRAQPLRRL
jgi:hypothetical protein